MKWVRSIEQGRTVFRLHNPNPAPVTPELLASIRAWLKESRSGLPSRCTGVHVREVRQRLVNGEWVNV